MPLACLCLVGALHVEAASLHGLLITRALHSPLLDHGVLLCRRQPRE